MSYPHRWVMYCKSLGVDPENYKPESNAGYITWVNLKWRKYEQKFGASKHERCLNGDRFDKWLSDRVSADKK